MAVGWTDFRKGKSVSRPVSQETTREDPHYISRGLDYRLNSENNEKCTDLGCIMKIGKSIKELMKVIRNKGWAWFLGFWLQVGDLGRYWHGEGGKGVIWERDSSKEKNLQMKYWQSSQRLYPLFKVLNQQRLEFYQKLTSSNFYFQLLCILYI